MHQKRDYFDLDRNRRTLGNFFVIPPTGRKIAYQAIQIHRIDNDGKIIEHRAIRDDLTFMMQLCLWAHLYTVRTTIHIICLFIVSDIT